MISRSRYMQSTARESATQVKFSAIDDGQQVPERVSR